MRAVLRIAALLLDADRWAMARGAALSLVVLVMGAALLGLSGWFITATGLAGLAGIGIAFDVFRPSAGVRFLALGRAAARYGERLLTHDATLRALVALRVVLLRGYASGDAKELMRLRGEVVLMRIMSDVDALDGLVLRLVLPVVAAITLHGAVFVGLGWLVGWPVALAILAGLVPAAALILFHLGRRSLAPSAQAEDLGQELRRGVIDMIRDREALIVASGLPRNEARLRETDGQARSAAQRLDRAERDAGFLLTVLMAAVAAGALLVGARMLGDGAVGPVQAVIGFFVALALAEAVLPLGRSFSDIGRMAGAAARVAPLISPARRATGAIGAHDGPLLSVRRPDFQIEMAAGQALSVTGPSGVGKSTLLMQIAGLEDSDGIAIWGRAPGTWPEDALRDRVSVLPQRSRLIAGTLRENLSLAGRFSDSDLWAALETVALADIIRNRGELDARLGEGGTGLSGGQARRLCLARCLLKRPELLLLDEPTEGLDAATADTVMVGIREALPEAVIVAAMHRGADHPVFDRKVRLAPQVGDDVTKHRGRADVHGPSKRGGDRLGPRVTSPHAHRPWRGVKWS